MVIEITYFRVPRSYNRVRISSVLQIPTKAVVLEESATVRGIVLAILKHGGFDVQAAATPEEGLAFMRNDAGAPVLLLLSATLAQEAPDSFNLLLAREPRPCVVLLCGQLPECPVNPGLPCLDFGCIRKPEDITPSRLIRRIEEILSRRH